MEGRGWGSVGLRVENLGISISLNIKWSFETNLRRSLGSWCHKNSETTKEILSDWVVLRMSMLRLCLSEIWESWCEQEPSEIWTTPSDCRFDQSYDGSVKQLPSFSRILFSRGHVRSIQVFLVVGQGCHMGVEQYTWSTAHCETPRCDLTLFSDYLFWYHLGWDLWGHTVALLDLGTLLGTVGAKIMTREK